MEDTMAKAKKINIEATGVDRLDDFLHRNIKKIVITLGVLFFVFVTGYIVNYSFQSGEKKALENLGIAEVAATTDAATKIYAGISTALPKYKDYIAMRSAVLFNLFNDKDETIKELQKAGGSYKDFSSGMLFDLGQTTSVNLNSSIKELAYYRQVLSAKDDAERSKYLQEFKAKYPDSQLFKLVNNWSIK